MDRLSLYDILNVFVQHLSHQQAQLQSSESTLPEAQQQLAATSQVIEHLRSAMALLRDQPLPTVDAQDVALLKDGRYKGGNGELSIELRIDWGELYVISADAGCYASSWL